MKIIYTIEDCIRDIGEIPLCQCGCGNKVNVNPKYYLIYKRLGYPKFIQGHSLIHKSQIIKDKISKTKKEKGCKPNSGSFKKGIIPWCKGLTKETNSIVKSISEKLERREISIETREKQRQAKLGKKLSPEHIEKLKQAHLGKKDTLETTEKRKQSQQKRHRENIISGETKEKLKQASKKRWDNPNERKKTSRGQLKRFEDPKEREKAKQSQLERYKDPRSIEKLRQGQLKRYENPEEREKLRQCATKLWKKSGVKEKIKQSMRNIWKDPEYKEMRRQLSIKQFEDPEMKNKCSRGNLFSSLDHLLKDPYCILWTPKLREEVRIRDGHVCQFCGIKQSELVGFIKKLAVHHIHYDKPNCYPDLITLCCSCNLKANFNRSYWESLFMNKLNDRELLFWTKRRKE